MARTNRSLLLLLPLMGLLRCSDSFDDATGLGQDVFGLDTQHHILDYSGNLPVTKPYSYIDSDPTNDSTPGVVPGLHITETWMALGRIGSAEGQKGTQRSVGYIEFDGGPLSSLRSSLVPGDAIDSIVVVVNRDPRDTIDGAKRASVTFSIPSTRKDPRTLLDIEALDTVVIGSTLSDSMVVATRLPVSSCTTSAIAAMDTVVDTVTTRIRFSFNQSGIPVTNVLTRYYVPMIVTGSDDNLLLLSSSRSAVPPRIDIYYTTVEDTGLARRTVSLRSVYSDFSVREQEAWPELDTIPLMTAAVARYAAIPLDLRPLWVAMRDTMQGLLYRNILSASLELPVSAAIWTGDSLTFDYHLSSRPMLGLETLDSIDMRHATRYKEDFPRNGSEGLEFLTSGRAAMVEEIEIPSSGTINIAVDELLMTLRGQTGSPPNTAYLYLALPRQNVIGSVLWGVTNAIRAVAAFSDPVELE